MESNSKHISDQHQLDAEGVATKKPLGEVNLPGFSCGIVGVTLAITLSFLGWYNGLDASLKDYYMGEPFYLAGFGRVERVLDWILVTLFSFGVAYAVLDIDRVWRRVLVMLMLAVVIVLSSPVLMLWDIFWSPVTVLVGVLWSWGCAFIYSCQHRMPCELGLYDAPVLPTDMDEMVGDAAASIGGFAAIDPVGDAYDEEPLEEYIEEFAVIEDEVEHIEEDENSLEQSRYQPQEEVESDEGQQYYEEELEYEESYETVEAVEQTEEFFETDVEHSEPQI